MKKTLSVFILAMLSCIVMADNGMVLKKTDGTTFSVAISDVLSIKFADGSMVINNKNATQSVFAIDDISAISFDDIETAIKVFAGDNADEKMVITDISGKIVYKGNSHDCKAIDNLHGIYIITVGNQSHKVSIK